MKKPLRMSRSYWETAVSLGGAKKNIVRDYDILKERAAGKTMGQLAIKYGLSEKQICLIINNPDYQ